MLQNKIYQNYIKEIFKTFFVILFGLSIIAWTVRAVNFLDLIVESGYSILTYFHYSFLNLFGILTKFIPLAFLLALLVFVVKQIQENEFVILWTSGVKKIKLANLFFLSSIAIVLFYLIFSTFLTPLALNKSRSLLSKDGFNSFLPTIRIQQFSDSFTGFTFFVEDRKENFIKNIFIHDNLNLLKNLTSNQSNNSSTTVLAQEGIVKEKNMILFKGQIITTDKKKVKNNIIKFEQLNIDLTNLKNDTIIVPKLQETQTLDLINCLLNPGNEKIINCKESTIKEIITVLNRRISLPLYIPIISLLCSFLLIKSNPKKKNFLNKYSIFLLCFLILLYSEIIVRYTGIYKSLGVIFLISPFILIPIFYIILMLKFSKESIAK